MTVNFNTYIRPPITKMEGLTLDTLEGELVKIYQDYHPAGTLDDMKKEGWIKNVSAHLEKKGNRTDSPILSWTEDSYYCFKITWEIEVKLPNGQTREIRKEEVVKTTIKLPQEISDEEEVLFTNHLAILYVKVYRHLHKASLCPTHCDHSRIQGLRPNMQNFVPRYNEITKSNWFGINGIWKYRRAETCNIRLLNAKNGKMTDFAFVPTQTARKVDDFSKKSRNSNTDEEGYLPGTEWKIWQADDLIVNDPRLKELKTFDRTGVRPEWLTEKQGNARIQKKYEYCRKMAKNKTREINSNLSGMLDHIQDQSFLTFAVIGAKRLFNEKKLIKEITSSQVQQLKNPETPEEDKKQIRKMIEHYRKIRDELLDFQRRMVQLKVNENKTKKFEKKIKLIDEKISAYLNV